jgi:hypothetical protein
MYANAALYTIPKTPEFVPPRGRPWDLVMDIWRATGPGLDWISPDIYNAPDFLGFCARYTQNGNPLYIPETRGDMEAKSLYVFGHHDAIGIALMGVERAVNPDPEMISGFQIIDQLTPLIAQHQGDGSMNAILMAPGDPPQKLRFGNYTFVASRTAPRAPATAPATAPLGPGQPMGFAGALIIQVGPDEFYAVGNNINLLPTVTPGTPGPEFAGIGTTWEVVFKDGRCIPIRQLSGDETSEGDYVVLKTHPNDRIPGDGYVGILHFTMYRYR